MKFTLKSISILAVLLIGIFVGASALQVYATGIWTPPSTTPPGGNPDGPITSGGGVVGNIYSQNKSGLLGLANLVVTNLNVASGTPGLGKVLMDADGKGDVTWATSSGASIAAQTCGTAQFVTGFTAGGTITCNFANPMATVEVSADEQAVINLTGTAVTVTNTTSGGASIVSSQFADINNGMPTDGKVLKITSLSSSNSSASIISSCPSGGNPANSSNGNTPTGMGNHICIYQQPTSSNSYTTKVWLWDAANGGHTWTFTLGYN